jgi:hypothetical protein
MKTKEYYLKDDSSNSGKDFIDENGNNVSLQENAISFSTRTEAKEWAENNLKDFEKWGYICLY